MNKQICQISFNTNNTGDSDRWKLLYDGQETFHSDIIVNIQTYTSDNYSEETKDNWNITFTGYLTMTDDIVYIKDKLEKTEESGFVDKSDLYKHLHKIASMNIELKESRRVFYEETVEHKFEINGQEHVFRVFDSMDEQQFWFDDEIYFNTDDEVMDNLTIQDLLDWI
jgi:dGTP triphosphohydrolase